MVVRPHDDAEPKRNNEEESLELTQNTAQTAFVRLGLKDAGGIWPCESAAELLVWLKSECDDMGDEKVRRLHELLLDGASDFTAARLLAFDMQRVARSGRRKFCTMLKRKQGISFYRLAASAVLRDPTHTLGAFQFERELGRGSFGLTWKVRDKDGHHCIKALALSEMTRRELEVKQKTKLNDARTEFERMSHIAHPNLVNVLDFGEDLAAQIVWAQLEFCDGGDLEKRLDSRQIEERGGVEESVAFRWMCECIAGLEAIHDAKVMHRDIKPENILLTVHEDKSARCKLADMGLACDVKATNVLDLSQFEGTPFYMAPEVLQKKQYSARADTFSLGMVIFELTCCGAHEFDNQTSPEKYVDMFDKLHESRGRTLAIKALRYKKEERLSSHELHKLAQSMVSQPETSYARGNYFAYIAIASPPFMLANGLAFAEQLKTFETRLRREQDVWLESNKCPICLSDADSVVAGADLRTCHARVFVWCATGHGWESRTGTHAIDFQNMVAMLDDCVKLLIICQRYGAQRAAKHAITRGVQSVVWISGDIHGSEGADLFFTIIVPLLDRAMTSSPSTMLLEQVIVNSRMSGISYGVMGNESVSYPKWCTAMSSPSGWLHVKVQDGLLGKWTRDSSLRSLKVFSCDISVTTRLKLKLSAVANEAEDGQLKYVWITSSSKKEETRDSRCRAVSLDVCESFAFSGQHAGPFQLIRRISNQQEIDKVEAMLPDMQHPRRVLLWVDLLSSGGLLQADDEYARSSLVTTLESVAARSSSTVVLFTSDSGSRCDLEAVVEELGSVEDAEFDIGEEEGVQDVEAANKHADAITLSADNPSALENFDLLRAALEKCLTSVPIAALYLNDDGGIVVRFCVSDVALLHRLAALVLTGRLP